MVLPLRKSSLTKVDSPCDSHSHSMSVESVEGESGGDYQYENIGGKGQYEGITKVGGLLLNHSSLKLSV